MGKRGGGKRRGSAGVATFASGIHTSLSLREEASGRKQSHNPKLILKLKHLQNLAQWASCEASVLSLGAFCGRRYAKFGEAFGISPDRSLFPCQSCETILRPGFNCSVCIVKNRAKRRQHHSNNNTATQNRVVYTCHFCSHPNIKQGTLKGYIREIVPSKAKPSLKTGAGKSSAPKCDNVEKRNEDKVVTSEALETPSPAISSISSSLIDKPPTPLATTSAKLLDSNRRKRKKAGVKKSIDESSTSSAPAEAEKASGTSRKRRKSWTTLKEIAASEEHERNQKLMNFSIPFLL